jgi:aspartate/methionine/tyrosine aminotransferase
MSKSFGLAGLRIGWIATKDKTLFDEIASYKNYTTICNSAASEFFAILALRNRDIIINRNLNIIKFNLDLLDDFFIRNEKYFNWIKPKAGSIAFPRLLVKTSAESFCLGLLKEKSVLLMPSTNYEYKDRHFRIGFGRKNMPDALKKLKEYLREKY